MNNTDTDQRHHGSFRKLLFLAAILGAAAAVYLLGYLPRERTTKQLDAAAGHHRHHPHHPRHRAQSPHG